MTQSYINDQEKALNNFLSKTYLIVAIGVGVSAVIAYLSSFFMYRLLYSSIGTLVFFGLIIGEFAIAYIFTSRVYNMTTDSAWLCYIGYSVLTGLSFSTIVSAYLPGSVAMAFVSTAIMFACMAWIGQTSKINFSKFYSMLLPFLIASIITSLLNAFIFHMAWIDMGIVYIGMILFLFITASDAKRLNDYYYMSNGNSDLAQRLMLIGAFQLYLDFVNLFIKILQVLGRRDRRRD